MTKGIKGYQRGHEVSEKTRVKIGLANRGIWVVFKCDNCGKENEFPIKKFKKQKTHFCNIKCYKEFCSKLPFYKQNAYKGIRKMGTNKQIYHQRYVKSHPERIAYLKAIRYSREKNAEGSYSLSDWQELKRKFNYKCAICGEEKPLTVDHIKPLSLGGTNYISNIQPLCRNCNSRKWKTFYENPNLIK